MIAFKKRKSLLVTSIASIFYFSPLSLSFAMENDRDSADTTTRHTVQKADVWAAGLYIWELLEDDTSTLFSCKSATIRARVSKYTYAYFEELVENVSSLKEKFSLHLLNLLRQVLTVDPKRRIGSRVIELLPSKAMKPDERRAAFEEVIRLGTEIQPASGEPAATPASVPVYQPADFTQYVPRENYQPQSPTYVPASLYPAGPRQANDNAGQMNPVFAVKHGE